MSLHALRLTSAVASPGAWVIAAAVLLGLVAGCANPMMPTGGPPDQTPPQLVESEPWAGAVNVSTDTDRVRLIFADYIDERSLEQSLSITPPVDGRLEFNWRGRRLDITFPHDLSENTTYILTLDTDLRTWRNVNLQEPMEIAFSTGDVIDEGQISGRVIWAKQGDPAEEFDVFAYPVPDTTAPQILPDRPTYRTQTDSEGRFHLNYLREQPYYVVAVRDQNRNRRPDPGEAFASPPQPIIFADTVGTDHDHVWIASQQDTIPPEILRTQMRSAERLLLRFNEPIQLASRDTENWVLVDSLRAETRAVVDYFVQSDDETGLVVRTEPMQPNPHRLDIPGGAITDASGTPLSDATVRFTPSAERDTVQTRFTRFLPARETIDPDTLTLQQGQRPGFQLNQPMDTTALRALASVVDSLDQPQSFFIDAYHAPRYHVDLDGGLSPGQTLRMQIGGRQLGMPADSVHTRAYRRPAMSEVGEITGRVQQPDVGYPVVVELIPDDAPPSVGRRTIEAGEDGTFVFDHLPEGTYHLRAFVDRGGTGTWDAGSIIPYRPPALVTWSEEPVRVRARWETDLGQPLRFTPEPTPAE